MRAALSKEKTGVVAVAGHAGCGHCHSHNQYIQDDSGGLAVVLTLFQEATGLSLNIKDIRVKTGAAGSLEVETEGGGLGWAAPRRGITLHEGRLARTLIGRDARRTQALVLEAFGRFYGQGAHETPVALQAALANAALDTFVKNYPQDFRAEYEDQEGSCGLMAGTVLDIGGIPVSVLGTVNASEGGLGPNEDQEGNSPLGRKGKLMAQLGMLSLPTIVVEGKVYTPKFCNQLTSGTFLVRADDRADNPHVAQAIAKAADQLGYPVQVLRDVMARVPGAMKSQTMQLADRIMELGARLKEASYAREKVEILGELALLVSQDGGGISFMSNSLNDILGGVGMYPGTSAVFSYLVPPSFYREYVFPYLTEKDVEDFTALTKGSVLQLNNVLPQALAHLEENRYTGDLDELLIEKGEAHD